MLDGKFICNKFMNISQSEYIWFNCEEVLIGKHLKLDVINENKGISLRKNHIITKQDIIDARINNYLIDLILATKE